MVAGSFVPGPARDHVAAHGGWLHIGAPDLRSADILTFAPDGLLLVGDSRGSAVFAFDVADAGTATSADVTVSDLDSRMAARLGTTPRDISIRDLAVHPKSHNVYLSVVRRRDADSAPILVRVSSGGRLDVVSLSAIPFARASLPNPPRPGVEVEGDPGWKWTISAMTVMDGRLYVAGMSNEEFSSTIRQLPLPFTGSVVSTGIRMYHAHHVRYETEAPITAFAPYTFFGTRFLVAAYSCTPLVLFPVDSLQDGAKITGKTIAELGAGNIVRDILPFDWEGKRYLAISNRNRSMQLLNATALPNVPLLDEHSPNPAATALYGLGSWLSWGLEAGSVAQVGILHLADFDADNALAVQRDVETGTIKLRLLKKPILYP